MFVRAGMFIRINMACKSVLYMYNSAVTQYFLFQNIPKDLDLSSKTDLDLQSYSCSKLFLNFIVYLSV